MPRRPSRICRLRNRQRMRSIRNVSQNENANVSVQLSETFKVALEEIPSNFLNYDCGNMERICLLCNALHFDSEVTAREFHKFTLCCHKGKVSLPPLKQNEFFSSLYNGLKSNDLVVKKRSKNYFENIRNFNSSFAMVSSETNIDRTVAQGLYHFKIHGNFYHRLGPLAVAQGCDPSYAQLYFYDVDTANAHRLRVESNQSCNAELMRGISYELGRINPFVQSFFAMRDYCLRMENEVREVNMVFTINRNLDLRRYNEATATDIAVIFNTEDGEPPFERNIVCFSKNSGNVRKVSVLEASLDPLSYPLLFPFGDAGWHVNIFHSSPVSSNPTALQRRNKVTMLQFACYRLAIRSNFSLLHHSQKLFLQWIVDMYVRIEGSRLFYLRNNQDSLRSILLNNLNDHLAGQANDAESIGKRVILPSSFGGSPRNMYQNYLDAMTIVQNFGKPSLFVTMTCNPNWIEIVRILDTCESSNFRPELIVRVFRAKLKKLICLIYEKHIFGKVDALIYTIEFQKRGLPHAHILITLSDNDKIVGPSDIDKVVRAELPNPNTESKLFELVSKHMMHGPCGLHNPNAICMKDGKCSKDYPKDFNEQTRESVNGYPLYRRLDNRVSADVRGASLDNRFVVPYNPYLLAKFNCHINVEVCTTVKSVKYIYKYVYKGYDCATVQLDDNENNNNAHVHADEISNFISGRYVGSTEATWRIFEFPMHFQSHTVIRLDIHLQNRQNIIFREGQEHRAAQNVKDTKLLAFFKLNALDSSANQYKYTEIPLHYVWIDKEKQWKKRVRRADTIISRMYMASPKDVELFHLRLLLLHVCGPKSFEDVRSYCNVTYSTFIEACRARGIASNDTEWYDCLNEAKESYSAKMLRNLFATICALNIPANASVLWNDFKKYLSEDFLMDYDEEISFNRALLEIEDILISHNLTCQVLGLPTPTYLPNTISYTPFNASEQQILFDEYYKKANYEQRNIIDRVLQEVQFHDSFCNVFCLTAHAGCGKTFVQSAIIHRIHALNLNVIVSAFSGIASTLLIGGRTIHNIFKLPIPVLENSVANIDKNSSYGHFINQASLIIIDEISMCPLTVLKAIDRLLRDLCTDVINKNKPFGGKPMLLCGDFRQILPVVPHGSRAHLVENCITNWEEFNSFHRVSLTQNMRVLPQEIEFVEFLKSIGNGAAPQFPELGSNLIEIPSKILGEEANIISDTYGDICENILTDNVLTSVILTPKNEDCYLINADIMNHLPGVDVVYSSHDKVTCEGPEANNYPVEFLNSLTVSGLPPHKLKLKINCIVLLIRNLNAKEALVNGTRMRIKALHKNSIDCEVLTGIARKKQILIPRINMTYSGTLLPFEFQRRQFPIIPAFAMTINKSQGQTFNKVGIFLREPVFTHGQLYVAASRVRSFDSLKFYICEGKEQGHLANDDRVFSKNIVYTEVLN